jgi:hypothetical protein
MIMPNPERELKQTNPTPVKKPKKAKRIRLTPKQKDFLHWVLTQGSTVESAMDNLRIWPRMLDRWLTQPLFNKAIDFKLSQFRLQTRINASLFAPRAVRTLGYMFNTEADFETKRKASVDLLKLLNAINHEESRRNSQVPEVSQVAYGGAQVAHEGEKVAHEGAPMAHSGSRRHAVVNENHRNSMPNPRFQLNIAEGR